MPEVDCLLLLKPLISRKDQSLTPALIIWGQVVKEGLGNAGGQVVQGRFRDEP
jgi:hypothetical protein